MGNNCFFWKPQLTTSIVPARCQGRAGPKRRAAGLAHAARRGRTKGAAGAPGETQGAWPDGQMETEGWT